MHPYGIVGVECILGDVFKLPLPSKDSIGPNTSQYITSDTPCSRTQKWKALWISSTITVSMGFPSSNSRQKMTVMKVTDSDIMVTHIKFFSLNFGTTLISFITLK
jgi:hypothetical protein